MGGDDSLHFAISNWELLEAEDDKIVRQAELLRYVLAI